MSEEKKDLKTSYSSEHIEVMSDIDQIRANPHLYAGSTEYYNHLIYEILDNAADEVANGYADKIFVKINTKTKQVTVVDNGRGIPVDKKDGVYVPYLITTKLFSSGKGKKQKNKGYEKPTAGLHGIGLTLVNALSKVMVFQIYRNNKEYLFALKDSKPFKESDSVVKREETGTSISFIPDCQYFERCEVNIKELVGRLASLKFTLGNKLKVLKLIVDDKEIPIPDDYLSYIFNNELSWIGPIVTKYQYEDMSVLISFDQKQLENLAKKGKSASFKYSSILNNIPMNTEGTHVKFAVTAVKDAFYEIAQKLKYTELVKDDFTKGLVLFVQANILQKDFNSQDKTKLTTPLSYFKERFSKLKDKIKQTLMSEEYFEKVTKPYIEILHAYKLSIANKNLKSTKHVKGRINRNLDVENLQDCLSKDISGTTLFIVEGDSAGGHLIDIRDKEKHAVFYLTGKPLNVSSSNIKAILNNRVIQDLIRTIGVGYRYKHQKENLENIRYEKIVILTDADDDGLHIRNLLLIFFAKMMPSLLENGLVYISEQPLYKVKLNKKQIDYLFTYDELMSKYPNTKFFRFKGLGEMEAKDLRNTLFGKWQRYVKIVFDDINEELKIFEELMNSSEFKKQLNYKVGIYVDHIEKVINIHDILKGE